MVNCFLVCSPAEKDGYRNSASKLDSRRLNKQCVEAQQVLNLVESFHVLGKMLDDPVPEDYKCYEWIRRVKKKYDKLSHILFLHQGKYSWYSKEKEKPKKLKYDEEYTVDESGDIEYKGKIYKKYSLILPGDNFFSLGFYSHPMVIMYMNYPDSLRSYINNHIDEFIYRGGKPGAIKRKCKIKVDEDKIVHPPWALDPKFHENHKAALLCKELAREEKPHYIHFPDFIRAHDFYKTQPPTNPNSSSDFSHYIWPFSQDLKNPQYL
jgi:hypothetical protein